GDWSLPQIAWHVGRVIGMFVKPAPDAACSPEQEAMKRRFYGMIAEPGGASKLTASPDVTPPATLDDSEVDRFIEALRGLKSFSSPFVEMGPLGRAPLAEAVGLHLSHSAHHLGFLSPK